MEGFPKARISASVDALHDSQSHQHKPYRHTHHPERLNGNIVPDTTRFLMVSACFAPACHTQKRHCTQQCGKRIFNFIVNTTAPWNRRQ
jgi:hypothetical protein